MFRVSILAELRRRRWTAYRLHQESGISKTIVYEYLRGRREVASDSLEALCVALSLRVVGPGSEST